MMCGKGQYRVITWRERAQEDGFAGTIDTRISSPSIHSGSEADIVVTIVILLGKVLATIPKFEVPSLRKMCHEKPVRLNSLGV